MLFGLFSSTPIVTSSVNNKLLSMRQAANLANHQFQTEIIRTYCHFIVAQPDLMTQAQVPLYIVEETAERVLIAHGRVDDWEILGEELILENATNKTNPQILLAAYKAWGEKVKQRLSGDWLIVDVTAERCIIMQCHQGYSSCYFQQQSDQLIVATRLPVLLATANRPLQPDWERIASWMLAWHQGSNNFKAHRTVYNDVYRIPCGYQLTFSKKGTDLSRYYWPTQEIYAPAPKTQEEAILAIEKLVEQAVKTRVFGAGKIATMLSGGFDSSTVTVYAAKYCLCTQENLPTYSHVPAFPEFAIKNEIQDGDETPLIQDVIAMTHGLHPRLMNSADCSVLDSMQKMLDILGQPLHAGINVYWLLDIFQQSAADGNTTLLSGEMGNSTTSFTGIMQHLSFRLIYKQRGLIRAVKHKFFTPYLIDPWRKLKKSMGIVPKMFFEFGYIRPELCEKLNFSEQVKQLDYLQWVQVVPNNVQDAMTLLFFAGDHPRGSIGAELSEYYGFMFSDPFSYRPLQQYMLSLPNEFYFDENGKPKAIIRKLMKDKLPTSILNASAKGKQSGDICRRIEAEIPAMAEVLKKMKQSKTVLEAIDISRLEADFTALVLTPIAKRSLFKCHAVTRALMLGVFLQQFDDVHLRANV